MRDMNTLDFSSIGVSDEDKAAYFGELRVLRAWYYMFLLDFFRQVPIATEQQGAEEIVAQSSAEDVYNFIESEIKEVLPSLPKEKRLGRWTQGPAAGLLVRLYLNSEVWIGKIAMQTANSGQKISLPANTVLTASINQITEILSAQALMITNLLKIYSNFGMTVDAWNNKLCGRMLCIILLPKQ